MRIIIVGAGGIGVELAKLLARRETNELVLIEADEPRCQELAPELDALILHGDGTNPEILAKAELSRSDALIAVTGSDALNTVIAMLGHLAQVSKIVVKLDEVGLRPACQEVGVSDIIAPNLASAARIVSVLYGTHRLDFSLATSGGLRLVELPPGTTAGKKLADAGLPDDVLVVAVMRGGESLLARGSTKIDGGDILLTLVEDDAALQKARRCLGLND